jgi:unsaturated rhamnogalacturonyl hydrolase
VARSVSERTARWPLGHWYWGDAIAVDGLLAVDESGLAPGHDYVVTTLQRWLRTVPSGYHDALGPGAAISRLAAEGTLPATAQERFLAVVESLPLLYGEVPALEPHLPRFRFGVCIDALYHLPPALAAAGRARGEDALVAQAVALAAQIIDRLRCSGGWAQWYDVALERNNNVPWSRGAGWALLGLLDTISLADGVAPTGNLKAVAAELLDRLVATQGPDGHWGPVLGREDLPDESSVAAFFVAGALHPQAKDLSVPKESIEAAVAAVLGSIDEDGFLLGVSADVFPDWDPAAYEQFSVEPSPWGQGAALRALAALAAGPERRFG